MNKQMIVKSLAKQLGWSQKSTEYYVAYILDYLILETHRCGEIRFDSHVFTEDRKKQQRVFNKITGEFYTIPEIFYQNVRRKRKSKFV